MDKLFVRVADIKGFCEFTAHGASSGAKLTADGYDKFL